MYSLELDCNGVRMEKLEISKKVQYLLENDRYICAPDLYDVGNQNNKYTICPIADRL